MPRKKAIETEWKTETEKHYDKKMYYSKGFSQPLAWKTSELLFGHTVFIWTSLFLEGILMMIIPPFGCVASLPTSSQPIAINSLSRRGKQRYH